VGVEGPHLPYADTPILPDSHSPALPFSHSPAPRSPTLPARVGFITAIVYSARDEDSGAGTNPRFCIEQHKKKGGSTMRLMKLAVVIGLLTLGILSPSNLQAARPDKTAASDPAGRQFSACPLPIPNCVPESVFDFKKCRCVPRP